MKTAAQIYALTLFLLLGACGSREELAWPIDQVGQRRVAYQESELKYTPEGTSTERKLRLAIWYPTSSTGGEPAKYMDAFETENAVAGGPAFAGDSFPVAIFSHGHLSFAEQSWFLAEYFASHGYLVLAPDHTGNTLVNAGEERPNEQYTLRPKDISAVLDKTNDLPGLSDRAGEEIVVLGHSFGGYTALAASGAEYAPSSGFTGNLRDERIDAAIPMAAGNHAIFETGGVAKIEIPVMLLTGGMDQAVKNATEGDLYWAELDGEDDRRVDLPRAGHHSFDIACEVFPLLGEQDGCGEGFLEPTEAQRLISIYALAFARRHLFGDDSVEELLDGKQQLSAEAVLSIK
jgi:predicted dienelactone hydrolase